MEKVHLGDIQPNEVFLLILSQIQKSVISNSLSPCLGFSVALAVPELALQARLALSLEIHLPPECWD